MTDPLLEIEVKNLYKNVFELEREIRSLRGICELIGKDLIVQQEFNKKVTKILKKEKRID